MLPVISRVAEPALVLDGARDAAPGQDVRLGGGATTIRQFLGVGCDREQIYLHMHLLVDLRGQTG
jgi:hypothetical protein